MLAVLSRAFSLAFNNVERFDRMPNSADNNPAACSECGCAPCILRQLETLDQLIRSRNDLLKQSSQFRELIAIELESLEKLRRQLEAAYAPCRQREKWQLSKRGGKQ